MGILKLGIIKLIEEKIENINFDREAYKKQILDEVEKRLIPDKVQRIKDPKLYADKKTGISIRHMSGADKDQNYFHLSSPLPFLTTKWGLEYDFPGKFNNSAPFLIDEVPYEKVEHFFALNKIKSVKFFPFEVRIEKTPACAWEDILPDILLIIFSCYPEKTEISKKEEDTQITV